MTGIPEGPAQCSLCHAPIVWRLTVGQRRFPLDPAPDPDGNVIVVELDDGRIRARVLCGPEMPAQQTAYRIHDCARARPSGPRCAACRMRMDAELAALEGWRYHPCCEPGFARELGRQRAAQEARAA